MLSCQARRALTLSRFVEFLRGHFNCLGERIARLVERLAHGGPGGLPSLAKIIGLGLEIRLGLLSLGRLDGLFQRDGCSCPKGIVRQT